ETLIGNATALETIGCVAPGFTTATLATPGTATLDAGTVALHEAMSGEAAAVHVVSARGVPFQRIWDTLPISPVPRTVSVKLPAPGATALGDTSAMYGRGVVCAL